MSTEYYSTKKIFWRDLKEQPLPEPLKWRTTTNERLLSDPTYVGSLTDGENGIIVWKGDHYYMQSKDPDVAIFERFGSNKAAPVLLPIAQAYDCKFVCYLGSVLLPDDEEDWNDDKARAEMAIAMLPRP